MSETTTVTQKGQVTIPVAVRRQLGLKPRDRVVFESTDGTVTIRKAPSRVSAMFGSVQPRSRPEDFRKLREEFEQGVADEVMSETAD